ncbi:hypothetical protein CAPTEDRAFT_190945 [Capitella teleta]|uniref:Uncharacterized protein n=1 Tax=Capitella teleta TaxID=283909 RepID=R7UZS6_CAPTE|nr:hypothetical protein CAPTEDRAFT_198627 [Capitella teleta]ELU18535.1 hypothetical protein CAPTEDRAFT_190945 [Capitella teleta]|eukprot:ELU11752.1 hypothetical protein CAPTEDRAFT_198627 [Capitella teleta]
MSKGPRLWNLEKCRSDNPNLNSLNPSAPSSSTPPSFADLVKTSVQSVLNEEKVKSDVIIDGLAETQDDVENVQKICETLSFQIRPTGVHRMGKQGQGDKPRLLKLTFPSAFDARTFQSKVIETSKADSTSLPKFKCRPGRTKEEQRMYAELSQITFNLNQEARDAGDNSSFSLRESLQIWNLPKNNKGKWMRDRQWKAPEIPGQDASGNA